MSLDFVFNFVFYQDWKIRLVPIIAFLILSAINLTLSKLKFSYQVCSTFLVLSAYSCIVLTLTITSIEHFNSGVFYFFPLITVAYLFIDGLKRNLMFIVFIISFFLYVFRQFIFSGLPTDIQFNIVNLIDLSVAFLMVIIFNYIFIINQRAIRDNEELLFSAMFHDIATPLNSLFLLTYDYEDFDEAKFNQSKSIIYNFKSYIEGLKTFQKLSYGKINLESKVLKVKEIKKGITEVYNSLHTEKTNLLSFLFDNDKFQININQNVFFI